MRIAQWLSIVSLIVFLCGCETVAPIIKPNQMPKGEESIVFGRFDMGMDNGMLSLLFKKLGNDKIYMISLLNHRTPIGPHKNDDPNGYFVVSLPPGQYQSIRIKQEGIMISSIDLALSFEIAASSSVYIGTLAYKESNVKNFLYLAGKHDIKIGVFDEQEETIKYLQKKGYTFNPPIVKSIFSKGRTKN